MKSDRDQKIRRMFYRIQGVVGMTERECRMFLMLALLLLIGSVSRYYYDNRYVQNPEAFAQFDAEFNRLTARADSLDRVQQLSIETAINEAATEEADIQFPADDSLVESRIDINRATSETLQKLPRIGPALAKQILLLRTQLGEFLSVDDLLLVSGIGEKTMARLRPLVTVKPADSSE